MRTALPIAAVLSAAALAAPAGAANLPQPPQWPAQPKPVTEYQVSQLPGPPTWPVNPKPITPVHSGSSGDDVEVIGLAVAVTLGAAGLAGAVGVRRRKTARTRTIAVH